MLLCHYARWFPRFSFCQIFAQFLSEVPRFMRLHSSSSFSILCCSWPCCNIIWLALLLLISLSGLCMPACLFNLNCWLSQKFRPFRFYLANSIFLALNNLKSVFGFSAEFNRGTVRIAVRAACRTMLSSSIFCYPWPTRVVLFTYTSHQIKSIWWGAVAALICSRCIEPVCPRPKNSFLSHSFVDDNSDRANDNVDNDMNRNQADVPKGLLRIWLYNMHYLINIYLIYDLRFSHVGVCVI